MITIFEILVVIFSVVLHEVAHGSVANALGDSTAKDLGRLTLNPIKHLDIFGSVLLPLFTVLLGGFIFGYAKPVPYNPANLSDRKYGPAKVAFAGPAVNLILALLFGLVLRFLPVVLHDTILPQLFAFVVMLNLSLALFNLIPIPPLDGHWLLLTFLPARFNQFKIFLLKNSMFIFIFFLLFIFPAFLPLINYLFGVIVGR